MHWREYTGEDVFADCIGVDILAGMRWRGCSGGDRALKGDSVLLVCWGVGVGGLQVGFLLTRSGKQKRRKCGSGWVIRSRERGVCSRMQLSEI